MSKYSGEQRNGDHDRVGRFALTKSDFGLSRFGDEYQLSSVACQIPIKWTAIEVLMGQPATTASDVWSFAIVCWEILQNGAGPYAEYSSSMILSLLKEGKRLSRPVICPEVLWMMMERCWSEDVQERPSFEEVYCERVRIEIVAGLQSIFTTQTSFIIEMSEDEESRRYFNIRNSALSKMSSNAPAEETRSHNATLLSAKKGTVGSINTSHQTRPSLAQDDEGGYKNTPALPSKEDSPYASAR